MLTLLTQKAIAVLHDIASGETTAVESHEISPDELVTLLARLEQRKLICRTPGAPVEKENSYTLCRPLIEVSLLDVLEATGEHLNCNYPTTEEFYIRYGKVAQKLGVINHMTRLYLSEINLTDC